MIYGNWKFDDTINGAIDWRKRKRSEFDKVWLVLENVSTWVIREVPQDDPWKLHFRGSQLFDNYWKARAYMQKMNGCIKC